MQLHAFFTFMFIISFASNAQPWRLCHEDQQYPPYLIHTSSANQVSGLVIDVLQQAATDANITLSFVSRPWKRCKQGVKSGTYDGLFVMLKTPERIKQFAYPSSQQHHINEVDYVILYKKDSPLHRAELAGKLFNEHGDFNLTHYKKIKKFGIQAPTGYVISERLQQHNVDAATHYDLDVAINQVAIGRLDGYIVEKRTGLHRVNALNKSDAVISSQVALTRNYWYVPFNREFYKKNKEDVARFWHYIQPAKEKVFNAN